VASEKNKTQTEECRLEEDQQKRVAPATDLTAEQ